LRAIAEKMIKAGTEQDVLVLAFLLYLCYTVGDKKR